MANNGRASRAAQFAPFDALKGLQDALREKEEKFLKVYKLERSEEAAEEVSLKLRKAEKGTDVSVTFYGKGRYFTLSGKVAVNNPALKF
ncbi:MAG: YolD-like family protein, partial [Clostridiales bacterium]|nr:YolD-like family protein [Clostridiales bacterium]